MTKGYSALQVTVDGAKLHLRWRVTMSGRNRQLRDYVVLRRDAVPGVDAGKITEFVTASRSMSLSEPAGTSQDRLGREI